MPPLPPTFDESTQSSIAAIQRRHNDMKEFQIPRLRNCKESLGVQQQYAAELREDLDKLSHLVEALEETIDDQKTERSRRELQAIVDGLKTDLAKLRRDMRAALLASKRAIDEQAASSREELLRSSVMKEKVSSSEKTAEDALMEANNNVTEALRRTMGIMQGELERSVLSVQMLESSTATLKATSSTHDVLTGLLGTSKQLITALEKSDWVDRLLIIAALLFFLLVVLFILKQRIVDRGLRIAFFWTRFLPHMAGKSASALDKAEKGQHAARHTTQLLSSVHAAISSAASSLASEAPVALKGVVEEVVSSAAPDATASSSMLSSLLEDASSIVLSASSTAAVTHASPAS